MSRFEGSTGRLGMMSLAVALGFSAMAAGCNVDYSDAPEGSYERSDTVDEAVEGDDASELGTAQQAWFSNPFNFKNSCSDSKGINSVMAALAVAAGTELKRWQPTKDFVSSGGVVKLTTTGKAQCADGKCWNTQSILDLQTAPAGKVQIRPGVLLDSAALKSALTLNLALQGFSFSSLLVPEHKLELMYSEPGGCDQYYWFNVTSTSGGFLSYLLTDTLQKRLKWVGGDDNPYIQYQSSGTMIGVDPTYGLNEVGATNAGSCAATCTKLSSTDITGGCCSCNGTKKFARSIWSTTTYICM